MTSFITLLESLKLTFKKIPPMNIRSGESLDLWVGIFLMNSTTLTCVSVFDNFKCSWRNIQIKYLLKWQHVHNAITSRQILAIVGLELHVSWLHLCDPLAMDITLFKSIIMLCGIDNILRYSSHLVWIIGNILWNILSPSEHCYGSE